jgi:hypothetical protein
MKAGFFQLRCKRKGNRARAYRPAAQQMIWKASMVRYGLLRNFSALLLVLSLTPAASAQTAKVGTLVCHISGGVGMILMENQALDCVFTDKGGATSHYIGRLTNVGLNIGVSGSGQLVWGVLAATDTVGPGALAGDYAGAQGSVAVGAGVGGAVLVGGSGKTISLQPISVSAGTGLNLSAGIGNVSLQYMPVTPPPPAAEPAPTPAPKKARARGH